MCSNPRLIFPLLGGRTTLNRPVDQKLPGVPVACGKCLTCALRRRGQWTTRGVLEAKAQLQAGRQSFMLTFTFAPEHLPRDLNIDLRVYQLLIKRLRKEFGPRVRIQGIGEYGGRFQRPHYHLSVFGLDLDDLVPSRAGGFQSARIAKLWPFGLHDIIPATAQSIGYVAAHQLKDLTGETLPDGRYVLVDARTGEQRERRRPFRTQSNRPGIGATWFDEYWPDLLRPIVGRPDTGWLVLDGEPVQAPDYFVDLLRFKDREAYERIKAARLEMAMNAYVQSEGMPDRTAVRDAVRAGRFRSKRPAGRVYEAPRSVLLVDLESIPEGIGELE